MFKRSLVQDQTVTRVGSDCYKSRIRLLQEYCMVKRSLAQDQTVTRCDFYAYIWPCSIWPFLIKIKLFHMLQYLAIFIKILKLWCLVFFIS
jgi:hypothetical protein